MDSNKLINRAFRATYKHLFQWSNCTLFVLTSAQILLYKLFPRYFLVRKLIIKYESHQNSYKAQTRSDHLLLIFIIVRLWHPHRFLNFIILRARGFEKVIERRFTFRITLFRSFIFLQYKTGIGISLVSRFSLYMHIMLIFL